MVSADRQQVIETNRSLRNIKNELESLLDKGVLSESAFDAIHALLPAEGTLGTSSTTTPLPTPTPATDSLPPSYSKATASGGGPPPLPGRKEPAPPPARQVHAYCTALYKYSAADVRDLSFSKGDRVAVFEKMNADWWLGRNESTGQEGIFPKAYVVEEQQPYNEKAGYPAPPGPQNPYNSSVPPMGIAGGYNNNNNNNHYNGEEDKPTKTEENTKKFGKKLGNAAIFGAGATLGGKIVNSIF